MTCSDLILAIDQGTTNTKALLVTSDGTVVHRAFAPNKVNYPQPGWAEQSAIALLDSVSAAVSEVLALNQNSKIAGIGISNQRESIVVWDRNTGEPVGPCIIWQCRRSAAKCEELRRAGYAKRIEDLTGLALDPLFPAAKIAWLLDNVPKGFARAERGELFAGTVDSWLLWKLTNGAVHATDHSNASRTQLFNTQTLEWDDELCGLFGVPRQMLPEVRLSDANFGRVSANTSDVLANVPVLAMIGDSHAALFGHGVRAPGTVKATYGTGTSLMALTPSRLLSRHGLSSTIAWSRKNRIQYAIEGNISVSGQAAAFMAELLGLDEVGALSGLANTVPDSNGVCFVPALVGLGAPYWRTDARGTITGMSLGTKPAHLARAALEAVAFQVAAVFSAMEKDIGETIAVLFADGGASQNSTLMQFQSDLLGRPVWASEAADVSALGAAAMAFSSLDIKFPNLLAGSRYDPSIDESARSAHLKRWEAALQQSLADCPKT